MVSPPWPAQAASLPHCCLPLLLLRLLLLRLLLDADDLRAVARPRLIFPWRSGGAVLSSRPRRELWLRLQPLPPPRALWCKLHPGPRSPPPGPPPRLARGTGPLRPSPPAGEAVCCPLRASSLWLSRGVHAAPKPSSRRETTPPPLADHPLLTCRRSLGGLRAMPGKSWYSPLFPGPRPWCALARPGRAPPERLPPPPRAATPAPAARVCSASELPPRPSPRLGWRPSARHSW